MRTRKSDTESKHCNGYRYTDRQGEEKLWVISARRNLSGVRAPWVRGMGNTEWLDPAVTYGANEVN